MDRFDNFIKKNILKISRVPGLPNSRNGNSGYIDFQISFDNFTKYLHEIKSISSDIPIQCTIYDETILSDSSDLLLRTHFLKEINKLNFGIIRFKLSESTLPIYNSIMDKINWGHDNCTFLEMTVDRKPTEIKQLNLSQARGKILLPEEKLLWVDDYTLQDLQGKVDAKVLKDTDNLKYVVRHFVDDIAKKYDFDKLTSFDKVYLAYHYIKDRDKLNIQFANECTTYSDGVQRRRDSAYHWESTPYETFVRRRGICEGQSRLMRVLLNNWDMELDATTIHGQTRNGGPHEWVGINIHGKLYYCCLTMGGLMQPMSYIPSDSELYPKIYPTASLNREQLVNIEHHVKSLRRK